MKGNQRIRAYLAFILTATLIASWMLNAFAQFKGTFKYEPHWSLIVVYVFLVGGGVFDMSVEALSLIRGFIKRGDEIVDKLIEDKEEESND